MEISLGYKQTEMGIVPEDWNVYELGSILKSMQLGGNYKNSERETNWPLIKMGNLGRGNIKLDKVEFVNSSQPPAIHDRLKEGDVLLNTRNTLDLVGKVAIWRNELPEAYFNSNIMRMEFDEEKVASKYFMNNILNTPQSLKNLRGIAIGTTSVAAIYNRDLVKIRVVLPTKAEQEAIAEVLSDADALIESLENLIAKKRQIKQGAMQELFRSKQSDEVRPLYEVSTLKGRIGWQGLKQQEFTTNEEQPFLITGMNFKDGEIRWNEVYHISDTRYEMAKDIQLRPGDVLMTKDGTIGKILYVDKIPYPGKASLNSHLLLFRPIRGSYSPKYLYYQLCSQRFKDFIELSKSGTTFFGMSQAAVGNYPVLLPKIEEQISSAAILSDMDLEIAALEEKLAKTRQIKQGMMQELLTGRIRLV